MLAAILLYALNLRGPIVALAPVIERVSVGLGISTATAGLLAGIPVFCFALAVPFASYLMRKVGLESAVVFSLLGVLIGTVIRSADGTPAAFAGMAIIGTAITIGNVSVPVIIGRDFPDHVGTVSGLYTAALNVGSVMTTLATAPLAAVIGWRWALAAWGVLVLVALIVWRMASARRIAESSLRVDPVVAPGAPTHNSVWKRWDAWALVFAFGTQSFTYYGLTAWLPTLLADRQGLTAEGAGGFSAVFQLFGIAGALGIPFLLRGRTPLKFISVLMTLCWFAFPAGLLFAPSWFLVWICIGGLAQGGNFTVLITLMVQRSRSQAESRQMSAMVQGLGYSLAALGPFAIGAVFSASGNWNSPIWVTFGALSVMGVMMFIVSSAGPYKQQFRTIEV